MGNVGRCVGDNPALLTRYAKTLRVLLVFVQQECRIFKRWRRVWETSSEKTRIFIGEIEEVGEKKPPVGIQLPRAELEEQQIILCEDEGRVSFLVQ